MLPILCYSLNSLEGVIWGSISGSIMEVIKGNSRRLDPKP